MKSSPEPRSSERTSTIGRPAYAAAHGGGHTEKQVECKECSEDVALADAAHPRIRISVDSDRHCGLSERLACLEPGPERIPLLQFRIHAYGIHVVQAESLFAGIHVVL